MRQSYSKIKCFRTCPLKYKAEFVDKRFPFEENEHTRYGKQVHKAAEEYIGSGVDLDPGYEQFRKQLDAVWNLPGEKLVEQRLALTEDKSPCTFFDRSTWYSTIVDLHSMDNENARSFVIDYKTGKATYPDVDQLELMALHIFAHYPQIKTVKAGLLFLTKNVFIKETYHRKNAAKLWQKWIKDAENIEQCIENDTWQMKPNGLCRNYCRVSECVHCG